MEYFADRYEKLKNSFLNICFNTKQEKLVEGMFVLMGDMAVVIDDLSDAVDELDMRLIEMEQKEE